MKCVKPILVSLALVIAVAGATTAAAAAFSASASVSPQLWTWYDESGDPVDERAHTTTTMALRLPVLGRFSVEVAGHSGTVISGFEGGIGLTVLDAGPVELAAVVRQRQLSVDTDRAYTVTGLGYGVRAGLWLFVTALKAEYMSIPSGEAAAGDEQWNVSGQFYSISADLFRFGPFRVQAGYRHEQLRVDGGGQATNQGALLGAAFEF